MNLPYCETLQFARRKSSELKLPMKIIEAEGTENGGLTFYFESENRIDFRELVKELNTFFNVPIRLEQIGSRDVPQRIGGIGSCGQKVCCHRFLTEFTSITNDMINAQNIFASPSQCTGLCGKLMCCLAFECPTEKLVKVKPPVEKVKLAQKNPNNSNCITLDETLKETPIVKEVIAEEQVKEETPEIENILPKKEKKLKKHKKEKSKSIKKKQMKVLRVLH